MIPNKVQWNSSFRGPWHEKEFGSNHPIIKKHTSPIKANTEKSHIGQGRAGMKRRRPSPINQTIILPSELSQKIPGAKTIEKRITNHANFTALMHSVSNANKGMTHARPLFPDVPSYPGPTYQPSPKPIRSQMPESHEGSQSSNSSEITNMDPGFNLHFEENSPFQEDVISEAYQSPIGHSFRNLEN